MTEETQLVYSYTNSHGETFFLHSQTTTLAGGRTQMIYFFSMEREGALSEIPAGYVVNSGGGDLDLPALAKKSG